jgi:hypothetical protein
MPFNGSGQFNRIFSWVADKAAGLDISSSRMDTDTDDIASSGFGNCITRDGQGQPVANLPMANFRHTSVGNGVARSDYSAIGQAQDGLLEWTIFGGTSDAITATYTPAHPQLSDGQLLWGRATAANATTTPTFEPDGFGPFPITRAGGGALLIGDIPGDLAEVIFRYNFANTRFELLNPSNQSLTAAIPQSGDVVLTLATAAPAGWLMFDDTTMGSAASGANHASAANQTVFTLLFNGVSDTNAPLLTSTGAATTRAAQGTAAAAWANNCRMSLPLVLGRALGVAGAGAGLTSQALGGAVGANAVNIAQSGLPNVAPTASFAGGSDTVTGAVGVSAGFQGGVTVGGAGSGIALASESSSGVAVTPTGNVTVGSINGGVTQTGTSVMQPSTFFNAKIKL